MFFSVYSFINLGGQSSTYMCNTGQICLHPTLPCTPQPHYQLPVLFWRN